MTSDQDPEANSPRVGLFIFQTQATLKVLGEHRGHVRFIGNFAKLHSCTGGAEKSGGFQEKASFTSVGQFGRDLASLTVGAGLL